MKYGGIENEVPISMMNTSNVERELVEEIGSLKKALELFTYSTSHDLRAPITTMLGLVNLIDKEEDVDNVRLYAQMIKKSLEKQDFFLRNISELMKIAKLGVKRSKINMKLMAEEVIEKLGHLDGNNEIKKIIKIKHNDAEVWSDKVRVWVVLNNLLSNSIKFQKTGNHRKEVSIEVEVSRKEFKIIVCDNGIGIGPENQRKVFDMFFRATDTNTGSGLGLYIVKETVESLKGKIKLTSIEGRGTCVKISVPNLV